MGKLPENPVSYRYFGEELIRSEDLDPVYVFLFKSDMPLDMLKRWLLAYWCYYGSGTASRIAEQPSSRFYDMMWKAWREKWPHGFERRHFYGEQARKAIEGLQSFGSAEQVVDYMTCHKTFDEVRSAVMSFRGFGPWIAFKISDMANRVLCYDIDFSGADLAMYADPCKGAAYLKYGDKHYPIKDEDMRLVVTNLIEEFEDSLAPPSYERKVNVQEIETILCKSKAYYFGQYYLGKDTKEVGHALKSAKSDLAQQLYNLMPKEQESWAKPYSFIRDWSHHCVQGRCYGN